MGDPVWFGNYIIPRWEAFLLMGGVAVFGIVTAICAVVFIGAMISWLVNPTAKPGKQ